MKDRIIFGATSTLAENIARLWARRGDRLTLVGRDGNRLAAMAKDLGARGAAQVEVAVMDFDDPKALWQQVEELVAEHERIDTLLVAQGTLGYGAQLAPSVDVSHEIWNVNFESAATIILAAKSHFVKNSFGQILAFGAAEGRLGREYSYLYGAAKAALETLMEGLREELEPKGVRVTTVIPVRVESRFNQAVPKDTRAWLRPEIFAQRIVFELDSPGVVFAPLYWRALAWLAGVLPEKLGRRFCNF